jgi:hypothetical protein
VFGLEGFRAFMVFKGTLDGEVFGYYVLGGFGFCVVCG